MGAFGAMPPLLYGTAWKEDRTESLVLLALRQGFRGIDTANQRKHYHEAGVGAALRRAFDEGLVRREDIFLQTKFTYSRGQDHRLPYDPASPLATQVADSCASSLDHLGVERLDAYLLHGPSTFPGIGPDDLETWRAMEEMHAEGRARFLGVSNVTARQLEEIHENAWVKPAIVQNRTFTRPHADAEVRAFCRTHGIVYEGFSLLTAIPQALAHPEVLALAARNDVTPAQAVLAACAERDIVILTGTSSERHMRDDLAVPSLALDDDAQAVLARLFA